ncbi:sugar nucleotidyltransferase [Croceibacter atlanticus]|uniref:sugar nucleotidyltransferase n=1 Tax=Croceibacter atlanticus TaxID=313588 RepID=UPI0030DBD468|tara:strand:+ start:112423 stop:113433 length:1011 start_codon:yes stop_codon:yes gene_type:complete
MKIIVPMAGRGSRLRPHTLTVPKPLIPIAGKPIVHRLVEDIAKVLNEPIDEIAFIIGEDFGEKAEVDLREIAGQLGAKGTIYYQDKPMGTGHAIMCAADSLNGPAVVAYADTLFRADFKLDPSADAVIWVKQVEDPSQYGVVQLNDNNEITALVEKPEEEVSDLAVIGIYYFKKVEVLKEHLQSVLENNILRGGEYQINDGILGMMTSGNVFKTGQIDEWMDCGNKTVTVDTNSRMLQFLKEDGNSLVSDTVTLTNSEIIEPCYIGENVVLENTTVGPNVSLGDNCKLTNVTIKNSLVQHDTVIKNAKLNNAMIGSHAVYNGDFTEISIGDYSKLE